MSAQFEPFEPWQRDLLEASRVARLATIGPAGEPHLVPVCFALAGGRVVIAIDEKPKRTATRLARLRNIARDPRITFLADRYDDDWQTLAWVRIDGQATVFERGEDQPAALAALRARYRQYAEMRLEELPLIAIEPLRVTAWRIDQAKETQNEGR